MTNHEQNTLQRVSRAWFDGHVTPPDYWASLDDMASDLIGDPVQHTTITDLVAVLEAAGSFGQPVWVDTTGTLIDGCHRYCAHVLAGSAEFDVWLGEVDPPTPHYHLEVELAFELGPSSDLADLDVAELIRSLPISPDGWMVSEILWCTDTALSGIYSVHNAGEDKAVEAIRSRLERHGHQVSNQPTNSKRLSQ